MNEIAKELLEALQGMMQRDERNTCQHENVRRGGVIWTICEDCGSKWADDEGGMPEWRDPKEWIAARAAIAKAEAALTEPQADADEWIPFIATADSVCPVSAGTLTVVRWNNGDEVVWDCPESGYWRPLCSEIFIIAYRIAKEADK